MVCGSNPGGGGSISILVQTGPTGPLYYGSQVFLMVKWPGRGVDHPPSSSTEVKETVELCIYSDSGPSWCVVGWTVTNTILHLYNSFLLRHTTWHVHIVILYFFLENLRTIGLLNLIWIWWMYNKWVHYCATIRRPTTDHIYTTQFGPQINTIAQSNSNPFLYIRSTCLMCFHRIHCRWLWRQRRSRVGSNSLWH
jgi:hypothetical protein